MNNKLPDKITRFDLARINYNAQKLCQCQRPSFVVDPQNRIIECSVCNAHIDPIDALIRLIRFYERQDDYFARRLEEQKTIQTYNPRLNVIKAIAENYGSSYKSRMWPSCPHCYLPFDLQQLLSGSWKNPEYAKLILESEGKQNNEADR